MQNANANANVLKPLSKTLIFELNPIPVTPSSHTVARRALEKVSAFLFPKRKGKNGSTEEKPPEIVTVEIREMPAEKLIEYMTMFSERVKFVYEKFRDRLTSPEAITGGAGMYDAIISGMSDMGDEVVSDNVLLTFATGLPENIIKRLAISQRKAIIETVEEVNPPIAEGKKNLLAMTEQIGVQETLNTMIAEAEITA